MHVAIGFVLIGFSLVGVSQDPLALIQTVLPLPISVLADRLKIVFAGKDFDRLRSYKVLMVSRARVRAALEYLCRHSPFYRDIAVDEKALANAAGWRWSCAA